MEWKPEFLEHVRIRYGNALSGEWPRLNLVRAMAGNAPFDRYDRARLAADGDEGDGHRGCGGRGRTSPEIAGNMAKGLQNAELVLIPNVGHNPHLEAPEIFNRELIRFLGSDRGALATER